MRTITRQMIASRPASTITDRDIVFCISLSIQTQGDPVNPAGLCLHTQGKRIISTRRCFAAYRNAGQTAALTILANRNGRLRFGSTVCAGDTGTVTQCNRALGIGQSALPCSDTAITLCLGLRANCNGFFAVRLCVRLL